MALNNSLGFLLIQNYLAFGQTLGSKMFSQSTYYLHQLAFAFNQIIRPLAVVKYSAFGCCQNILPSAILCFQSCFTTACHLHYLSLDNPWLWQNYSAFGKGPIIEPLVRLWVQSCFTACQPLALAPSFWWSFPQCLRDRIHFLTPFLIGFSADV